MKTNNNKNKRKSPYFNESDENINNDPFKKLKQSTLIGKDSIRKGNIEKLFFKYDIKSKPIMATIPKNNEEPTIKLKLNDNYYDYDADDKFLKKDDLIAKRNYEKNLTVSQKQVVQKVKNGESIFFSGSAGTGKSYLLHYLLKYVLHHRKGVYATAPTGLAAINISGITLYSWAGIGIGEGTKQELYKHVSKKKQIVEKWKSTKILIIDEASMISSHLFDKMDYIGQTIRKNKTLFGGIQLIVSGDFLQLPPIPSVSERKEYSKEQREQREKQKKSTVIATHGNIDTSINNNLFCFQAKCWNQLAKNTIYLNQVFRQTESKTIECMNQLRTGTLTQESIQLLQKCVNRKFEEKYNDGIIPTELYMIKVGEEGVKSKNDEELKKLKGDEKIYDMIKIFGDEIKSKKKPIDIVKTKSKSTDNNTKYNKTNFYNNDKFMMDNLIKNCPAPEKLVLKIGAQVMLLKNLDLDAQLINGSRGVVTKFEKVSIQNLKDGDHDSKNENESEDKDDDQSDQNNQSDQSDNDDDQSDQDDSNKKSTSSSLMSYIFCPVVQFTNGVERLIKLENWDTIIDGRIVARVRQIPLILAWALTVHKCQGMSLDRVRIHFANAFEDGQIYVAISRAKSLDGLSLIGFNPLKIKTNAVANRFYKNLNEKLKN